MVRLDQNFLTKINKIARRAGAAILDIYHQDFEVELKDNGSPLTLADQAANEIIVPSPRLAEPAGSRGRQRQPAGPNSHAQPQRL